MRGKGIVAVTISLTCESHNTALLLLILHELLERDDLTLSRVVSMENYDWLVSEIACREMHVPVPF